MPWSLNIGKIGGTEIRIHVTFLLFLAWIWAASYMAGGAEAAIMARRVIHGISDQGNRGQAPRGASGHGPP